MKFYQALVTAVFILSLAGSLGAQDTAQSTAGDQTNVEVTVYNNNFGLVKDTRDVTLPPGSGELRFMDVAAHIMPVTVHAKSMSAPEAFHVLEQNYEYDLIDYNKLLDKYVGQKVKLLNWNQYQDRKEVVDAELISNNNGNTVYKIDSEIYLGHPGYRILPELPESLIAKPTLMWLYQNTSRKPHQLEVSYLTNHIAWKADYVLVLNKDDTLADLSGWVTVDNRSGAAYENTKLKLVAGDVQRVQLAVLRKAYAMDAVMEAGAAAPQFQEQGFFEYHIYDLQRRTTIKNNQTKQISLLEAQGVKVRKEFLLYGQGGYYTHHYRPQDYKQKISVYVKFRNEEANHLGMPLPAGVIRLYKKDSQDSLQFIGEDRVDHTPKNEEVKLKVGEAFDVVAERRQTDYKQLTTRLHESEWEIVVRNHKEEDVTVGIIEPMQGNWKVIQQTQPFKKIDAFTIRFDVDVPKDGEVKVVYRVQVGI